VKSPNVYSEHSDWSRTASFNVCSVLGSVYNGVIFNVMEPQNIAWYTPEKLSPRNISTSPTPRAHMLSSDRCDYNRSFHLALHPVFTETFLINQSIN